MAVSSSKLHLPTFTLNRKRSVASPSYGKQTPGPGCHWPRLAHMYIPRPITAAKRVGLRWLANPRSHGPIQITWTESGRNRLFPKGNLGFWSHEEGIESMSCNKKQASTKQLQRAPGYQQPIIHATRVNRVLEDSHLYSTCEELQFFLFY